MDIDMNEIKITEEEWKENGIDLLGKYSLIDIMNYFVEVEWPKVKREMSLKKDKKN